MKKLFFALIVLSAALIAVSCTKADKSAEPKSTEPDRALFPTVVLYNNAAGNSEEESFMVPRVQLGIGDIVDVIEVPDSVNPALSVPEKKEASRKSDKQKRDYYHIVFEGKDYWIQDYFVAPEATPGVVLSDNVLLYNKPELAAVTTNALTLPQYAIIGVHTGEDANGFLCVSAYIDGRRSPVVTKRFIKRETVTMSPTDVQAMQLYKKAEASPNNAVKKELLTNAYRLGSEFEPLVFDAMTMLDAKPINFTIELYDGMALFETVSDGGSINVRNKAGAAGSTVSFTLSSGVGLTVKAFTKEQEIIDGDEDRWYQVRVTESGQEGWIFGKYIREL